MMEALGAIAAEPGEVPDCNCSFFKILFYFIFISSFFLFSFFHTHKHIPPTPQVRGCVHTRLSLQRGTVLLGRVLDINEQILYAAVTKSTLSDCGIPSSDFAWIENLSLCHPLGLFLLPTSNQALFYCILCQCVNDFVRIPQPCPACRVSERTRAGGWQALVGFLPGEIEGSSWREQQLCLSCLCIPLRHTLLCPSLEEDGILFGRLTHILAPGCCDHCVSSACCRVQSCPGCTWCSRRGGERQQHLLEGRVGVVLDSEFHLNLHWAGGDEAFAHRRALFSRAEASQGAEGLLPAWEKEVLGKAGREREGSRRCDPRLDVCQSAITDASVSIPTSSIWVQILWINQIAPLKAASRKKTKRAALLKGAVDILSLL